MITRITFICLFLAVITETFYYDAVLFSQEAADTVTSSVQAIDKNESNTIGSKSITS